jgi:hypothetical protein
VVQAAERMELSYRQGKRLWRRYREQGAAGLGLRPVTNVAQWRIEPFWRLMVWACLE